MYVVGYWYGRGGGWVLRLIKSFFFFYIHIQNHTILNRTVPPVTNNIIGLGLTVKSLHPNGLHEMPCVTHNNRRYCPVG